MGDSEGLVLGARTRVRVISMVRFMVRICLQLVSVSSPVMKVSVRLSFKVTVIHG